MNKFLLFNKDIVSDDRMIKWFAGQKYKIIKENDTLYYLESQNGIKLAIEKKLNNNAYTILTEKVDLNEQRMDTGNKKQAI